MNNRPHTQRGSNVPTQESEDWVYEQIEQSYNSKDQSDFTSIFKKDVEFPQWKDSKGQHWIDILPYTVGNNDPIGIRSLTPGSKTYKLELWVHYNVGLNGTYVCLYKNYKEPCPVCNFLAKLKSDYDANKELIDKIKPKRRVIYNIICRDNEKEAAKGIQVFETSHYLMEAKLSALAKNSRAGSRGWIPFPSIKNGKIIGFDVQGEGLGKQFIVQFDNRDYEIPMSLASKTYTLDELIYKPTFDEVQSAMSMGITDSAVRETKTYSSSPHGEVKEAPNVECPASAVGGSFGDTTDDYEECTQCANHGDCEEEFMRRNQ